MTYDVIVLGSGQAGTPLAARLAERGRAVLLAEGGPLGGTCVNTGCTPTKTMIASARAAHVARNADRLGVRVGEVSVDYAAVVDRKDAMVGQWRDGVRERLEKAGDGLTLVREYGRFVGPRTVEVGGVRHDAEIVIINVGGRPVVPPVEGLDDVPFLDNGSLMALRELPRHLLVMGGGYVGCELGQAYRRFGAEVTIVERADHLLPREDEDVSEALQEVFTDEGIGLRLGARVEAVRSAGAEIVLETTGGELRGSHLLVATGRRPNTDRLGCDEAGIELDDRGYIVVDDRYRTRVEGVYAVGDVTGGPQFTHASWDDYRILFDLLHGDDRRTRADRLIPQAVFTDPQVARVGLSVREAEERDVAYELATLPFGRIARAREVDEQAGLARILIDPESERVLGAAVVGREAAELIHIFAVIMEADAPARAIADAEAVHPSFAEGMQTLVTQLERYAVS